MPIYDYRCKSCGHTLEALQKMSDDFLTDCPACERPDLSRQLSAPRFRLKGNGWYETDFKTGSKKNLAGDREEAAGGSSEKKTATDTAGQNASTKNTSSPKKTASASTASSD